MALSAITQVMSEAYATAVAAFTLTGVPYLLWRTDEVGTRRLWWRRHDGDPTSEVGLKYRAAVQMVAAAGRADGTSVLLVYTTSPASDGVLWALVADIATGEVTAGPIWVGRGTRPALAEITSMRSVLAYLDGQTGALHLRETYDGGLTWSTARPVLNNKVVGDSDLSLVVFDGTHLSIGQVGRAGRAIQEVGSADRSRPVTAVAVPAANRLLAVEAAYRTGQTPDSLRGRVALDGAGNVLAASRARLGTDDGLGDVALYAAFLDAPAALSSAVLAAGAAPGGEIVRAPADGSGPGAVIQTLAGAEVVADLSVFAGFCLYAGFASTAATGRAGWVDLGTLAGGEFDLGLGVTRCGAIAAAVANAGGFDLLAVGFTTAGGEWLRLGAWAAPPSGVVLGDLHAMPARINALAVTLTSATAGRLYVGMADRINVYAFDGLGAPIRLLRSHPLLTGGEVHQIVVLDSENVVAALGAAGVGVFGPGGEMLGHATPSTIAAMPWQALVAYGLGALVQPTGQHPYAPQRRYFTNTRAGTSGSVEPGWGPTGTINDPNGAGAGWTEVGVLDAVITGVAVDRALGRIYAAGVLGGPAATRGRIFSFDTTGLLSAPPRAPTPLFNIAEGSLNPNIVQVVITSPLATADVYYTRDGSPPGPDATLYPPASAILFDVSGAHTLRAVAIATGFLPSRRADLHFTVDLPNLPAVLAEPNAGTYFNQTFNVTLSCAELGVDIHYTLDGSTPTAASPVYAAPIAVTASTTIRAVAMKYGFDDSPIADHAYTLTFPLIPIDPAALTHVLVSAGVLNDLNGSRGWIEVGNVPATAPDTVVAGRQLAEGVGPFSDAAYYELGGSDVGTDPLDAALAGDVTITLIFKTSSASSVDVLFSDRNVGGLSIQTAAAPNYLNASYQAGSLALGAALGALVRDGNPHVVTFARTGGTWFWKVDKQVGVQGATAIAGAVSLNTPARIGRFQPAGAPAATCTFYEMRIVAGGPASMADLDTLHAAIIP